MARKVEPVVQRFQVREVYENFYVIDTAKENAVSALCSIGDTANMIADKLNVGFEPVAWCVIHPHNERSSTIHLCDSDEAGAFRVFRSLNATGESRAIARTSPPDCSQEDSR